MFDNKKLSKKFLFIYFESILILMKKFYLKNLKLKITNSLILLMILYYIDHEENMKVKSIKEFSCFQKNLADIKKDIKSIKG